MFGSTGFTGSTRTKGPFQLGSIGFRVYRVWGFRIPKVPKILGYPQGLLSWNFKDIPSGSIRV